MPTPRIGQVRLRARRAAAHTDDEVRAVNEDVVEGEPATTEEGCHLAGVAFVAAGTAERCGHRVDSAKPLEPVSTV